ncbi:MAG: DUF3147 family protein [Deltaproteobacteria bacterium]|nr:DUF3147 family protein [Deltaproteobacteria bacterium]
MTYYLIKIVITLVLIVVISEVAKKSALLGGIFATVPLISMLAIVWLYMDTKSIEKVSALATSVFWLVIPSLALFVALPVLLKKGLGFYWSMCIALMITALCYYVMIILLEKTGFRIY